MKKLLFMCLALLANFASASIIEKKTNEGQVTIEGRITDAAWNLFPEKEIKVTVNISSFSSNPTIAPITSYTLETKYNKLFKFIIPAPAERFYMTLFFDGLRGMENWQSFANVYILEEGDEISCELSGEFFYFSGKGSEKLQCQSEMYKHQFTFDNTSKDLINSRQFKKHIAYINAKADSVLKIRIATVNGYSTKLPKDILEVLLANCYGLRYFSWFWSQFLVSDDPEQVLAFLESEEFQQAPTSMISRVPPEFIIASPNYCDYLFEKIKMESVVFDADGKVDKSPEHRKRVFQRIKTNYTGIIRDKLLTMFFLCYKKLPHTDDYMDEALGIVTKTDYRHILLELERKYGKGIPFHPFALADEQGKVYTLKDFESDIVILDFWYTGCINCVKLAKIMTPVVDRFKTNPYVKFVSISIDKDKTTWIKSIKEGKYTHPSSINLYAGGKGSDTGSINPLIAAYGIQGYPTVFILNKGKMYEATPPSDNPTQMINLIQEALSK
ncbi:TlpA family protein disulfide reductase [Pedobacter sp. GR22-6]|uniref:TlpA family protein disulfide reductase n=1 Tax=Pedobacter sp. GR22-6 TaxID=3127957 RepID=UPI00307FA0EE